jgi:hypothetical protein
MGAAVSESTSTQVKLTTVDRSKNAPAEREPSRGGENRATSREPTRGHPYFSQWSTSPASALRLSMRSISTPRRRTRKHFPEVRREPERGEVDLGRTDTLNAFKPSGHIRDSPPRSGTAASDPIVCTGTTKRGVFLERKMGTDAFVIVGIGSEDLAQMGTRPIGF